MYTLNSQQHDLFTVKPQIGCTAGHNSHDNMFLHVEQIFGKSIKLLLKGPTIACVYSQKKRTFPVFPEKSRICKLILKKHPSNCYIILINVFPCVNYLQTNHRAWLGSLFKCSKICPLVLNRVYTIGPACKNISAPSDSVYCLRDLRLNYGLVSITMCTAKIYRDQHITRRYVAYIKDAYRRICDMKILDLIP